LRLRLSLIITGFHAISCQRYFRFSWLSHFRATTYSYFHCFHW
jgi:hypothetical protein